MSFYLLHRGWMDNPIFSNEPFTEKLAWIWMIQEASYEPHKVRYHSHMIEVGRGQIPTSYRKLKDIFQWGNERVKRFLNLLVTELMITLETGTGFLIITICNYEKYQRPLKISGTQSGTDTGTVSGTQSGTNINKGNKVKEIKEKNKQQRGSRFTLTDLPDDWRIFCQKERPDLNPEEVFKEFKDYWIGVPGQRGRKLDWHATWRNRVRDKKKNPETHRQSFTSTAFDQQKIINEVFNAKSN